MNHDQLMFYDIEVFKENSLVVFKDIHKQIIKVFHNNFVGLREFVKGKILVGFNNYHYDDKILTYMIELKPQALIKQLNDRIISGKSTRYMNKPPFKSLDTFQQIDVSNPSLKKIQGNLGRLILESSVSFSLDRALLPEEYEEVLFYCANDVDTAIDIYLLREKSYFQPKQSLLDMLGKETAARWNTTTISANLLLDRPLPKWERVRIPEDFWTKVPQNVREFWESKGKYYGAEKSTIKHVEIEDFDCVIQFGLGGLHGAHKTIKKARNVKLLDVTSMYPSIILILKILGFATDKYRAILEERILAKKSKNFTLSEALKLILNSVYGNLGNEHSLLYNPMALLSVCYYGQIALYDLCKRISPFATIININTDGVAFIPHSDGYIVAYEEWQKEFSLSLEEKFFKLLVQKDVNNYIAVKEDDSMICKGGDVNRYDDPAYFKNANARILDICLVEHLVNDADIIETINSNLDKPHLFQYILKAGSTYKGVCKENGEELNTKVNRVFASQKNGYCLYKKRHDNGLVKFADAPVNMYLHNGECDEIVNFEEIVDIEHYYNIITKRVERWT